MSPATDGDVEGRSPVARPLEFDTVLRSTENFVVDTGRRRVVLESVKPERAGAPGSAARQEVAPGREEHVDVELPMNSSADDA